MTAEPVFWKRCSTCKKALPFEAVYWECNVSTCNRPRTALAFCSVPCWDAHVPTMRHRDAWAEERRAPRREEWERQQREEATRSERAGARASAAASPTSPAGGPAPREVLVIASRLKAYVRARSGMNTSDAVLDVLSDKLRVLCDEAVRRARLAGRQTVLDRDF